MPKLLDRFALLAVRALRREARGLREAIEAGVDSYRAVNNLPPLFHTIEAITGVPEVREAAGADRSRLLGEGDNLSWWLIEELALETHTPIEEGTDLEQLALDRGWLNPDGKFLLLPSTALDHATADDLMAITAPAAGTGAK